MEPNYYVTCPLFPLFPRNQGYSEGYHLPARMRPKDCVDLKKLTEIFRESLLYEEKYENDTNPAVISVLSPYSKYLHVMVLDLSPTKYLPAPEWFSIDYFQKICNICNKVVCFGRNTDTKCLCAGYNWSPFSYGSEEEKTGAQSVTTKFHFSIWSWNDLMPYDNREISSATKRALGDNEYGLPFAKMIWEEIRQIVEQSNLFSEPETNSRSLFLPFKSSNISTVLQHKTLLYSIAEKISTVFSRLSSYISNDLIDKYKNILKETENRPLTDEELEFLRTPINPKPLEEILSKCQNNHEKAYLSSLYESMINRFNQKCPDLPMWRKNFGYSLVLCESEFSKLESGLRIYTLPQCGPGGVVEALGCILTRPENAIAKEEDLIYHNNILWDMADYIRNT